jgi:hypothetical protein
MTDTDKDQLILKLVKQVTEQSHAIGYALGVLENLWHVPLVKKDIVLQGVIEMLGKVDGL